MFKKIKYTFFLICFGSFIIFLTSFYFSDENIKKINKSRLYYSNELNRNMDNLPLLKSDTNDIIEYLTDKKIENKKKKYNLFWKLIE